MPLTDLQRQVLIGTLLGDGHLERNGHHVRLKIDHSLKQKAYAWWKYQVLKNITPSPPKRIAIFDSRTQKVYKHYRFATFSSSELEDLYSQFYTDGTKKVPSRIRQLLTEPVSLAVWYMDDGARRTDCQALRIHTNSYALAEVQLLQNTLQDNFSIQTSLHRAGKNGHVLYIPSRAAQAFCNLIRPFTLSIFKDKLL